MSPTNLRDLEKQITLLMKLESGTLDVNSFSSSCSLSEQLEGSAVQNGSRLHLTNEQAEVLSTVTVSPQCNSVPSRWREATGKWRQLFNCVQTVILGFMSRIGTNHNLFGQCLLIFLLHYKNMFSHLQICFYICFVHTKIIFHSYYIYCGNDTLFFYYYLQILLYFKY